MSQGTLYDKVWDAHAVEELLDGRTQLAIDLHLIHEVTSPQGFAEAQKRGYDVTATGTRTFATADHIIPTDNQQRPFKDQQAEEMMVALEKNTKLAKIQFAGLTSQDRGIVHVIGPQLGLTQPGLTIVCGDSHTSTHGAFGNISMGIGSTEVGHVLGTGSLAKNRLKVRRININGELEKGVTAKDVILHIIHNLGVGGGKGYAYEYGGEVVDNMTMEERMTMCNMSIEGGALCGYVNPDETTYEYMKGRKYAPKGEKFDEAIKYWNSLRSDDNAKYDDVVEVNADDIDPMVTWGINPGQSVKVNEPMPNPEDTDSPETAKRAYAYTGYEAGKPMENNVKVGFAFLGSCTNSRITDLRAAAEFLKDKHVAEGVTALAVPGSDQVKRQAEEEGLDKIFKKAGFEWREAGCSMCLGMNPDQVPKGEVCASSSNRNFMGRQGPGSKTVLMSPIMVAAAAVNGRIVDVRKHMK